MKKKRSARAMMARTRLVVVEGISGFNFVLGDFASMATMISVMILWCRERTQNADLPYV